MKILNITSLKNKGYIEVEDEAGRMLICFSISLEYEKDKDGKTDWGKPLPPKMDTIFEQGEKELSDYIAAKLFQEYKSNKATLKELKK